MTIFHQGVDVLKKSWPKTEHDTLPVPGGRKLGEVETNELVRLFQSLKIPGVTADQGRAANVAHYAKHLQELRERAADAAVSAWLAGRA